MRDCTNKLLEMIDEGLLDARTVVSACLKYMSEDEVEDIARMNEFLEEPAYKFIFTKGRDKLV